MEYAEGIFGFAALLAALLCGLTILGRRGDGIGKLMGWTALALFLGETLRFLPWLLARFGRDVAFWATAGRMAAALAVTVVCILLSLLREKLYDRKNSFYTEMLVRDLSGIRALGCVAPVVLTLSTLLQGEFYDPLSGVPPLYALIAPAVRSVPLLIVAAVVARLWRPSRDAIPTLRPVWLALALSAVFGAAADVGAVFIPALGLLWIAQTACLLWIAACFVRYTGETGERH